jgi:hypothetical protein
MSTESHKPVPRVDSFEITEADCTPLLTDEEKNWPVVQLQPRVDGFEVTEVEVGDAAPSDVALKVTVTSGATPADLAVVLQKLRAAVEEARAATGGRVSIRLEPPSDAA